ncbi:MAG TPA: hypothetical protein VHD33_01545, partial [Legionellaceae bacterium]|nr:hypothetical protein [Legionellaceae bacterium]
NQLQQDKKEAEMAISFFLQQNTQAEIHRVGQLKAELEIKKNNLSHILQKLEIIQKIEQRHSKVVQWFLRFIRGILGTESPLQMKEKERQELENEIKNIQELLSHYEKYHTDLAKLYQKQDLLNVQSHELEVLQTAKRTREDLQAQINHIQSQIDTVTKEKNNSEYRLKKEKPEEAMSAKEALKQQKKELAHQLQTISTLLENLKNPSRIQLIELLTNSLITADSNRLQNLSIKPAVQYNQRFFQHLSSGAPDVHHFNAITKYSNSIKVFMHGLDAQSTEYKTLRDLSTVLLQLQIMTDPASIQVRQVEELKNRFTKLLEELPVDNPLRATKKYLLNLLTQTAMPMSVKPVHEHKKKPQMGKG